MAPRGAGPAAAGGRRLLPWWCLLAGAGAWGPDGHTVVAHLADRLLDPAVEKVLRSDLLNTSLSEASVWCDDFDHTAAGRWSSALHYINYPGRACSFDWGRDCARDWCNVGALVNYTRQVFDASLSPQSRLVALKFVIHLMGDLHQPLHVASADDWGGNKIELQGYHFSANASHWHDEKECLHAVWDRALVVQSIYDLEFNATLTGPEPTPEYHDWRILAEELWGRLRGEWRSNCTAWQATVRAERGDEQALREGLSAVAGEVASLGCRHAYVWPSGSRVRDGDVLDRSYYLAAKPVVETQLAKGGARLAQLLSDALEAARGAATKEETVVVI